MKIVNYNTCSDIQVEFQDEHKFIANATYQNFKRKTISNPYDKSVCGIGYIGEGKYSYQSDNKVNKVYDIWKNMLRRCYSDKLRWKFPAYEGSGMVDEWLNLQNFCEWYFDNHYDVGDGGRMHIDKDILFNGNMIYAPDKCIIVPQRINMIFMSKGRKDDLPTGITQNTSGTYVAHYNGKRYGTYKTLEEAVAEHDRQKRIHIRQVIKEYGNKLPEKVINALLEW